MHTIAMRRLCGAVMLGLLTGTLAACGGGGGNGGLGAMPAAPPAPPPPAPPPPAAPAPPPPPIDAQLSLTDTYAAHAAGYTGAGVVIGFVDSGIMRSNPTVAGRVIQEYIDVDPTQNNTRIDDVVGHGTWVASIAAGVSFASFPGGIAPGASLVSARIIADNAPSDHGQPPSQVTASEAQSLGQVNQQLISSGVKVMNNSWGGITWDTTSASVNQAFDAAYQPYVLQQGGLVVFAAGNGSAANPSTIAALPAVAPDLTPGWLTVVAVDSNHPTQLASYSNQCGVAMNDCLAAPGDVIVLDKDTTASTTHPTYYVVEGTSLAAPQVTGAAALVWQAFPYFTNDLVRQTLLGTADPLGGSQPNTTFGYGELDVGRAVQGPAQFNWGNVSVSFDSLTSTWGNNISGAGGLIKNGSGTLVLTGNDSYTGGTQILGGTVQATHPLPLAVDVGAGATLAGAGGGSITNAGTVVVKGGNMSANEYTQTSTGTLSVSLGSVLGVAGAAQLAGTLNVVGEDSGYVTTSQQDVVTATLGVKGTFTNFTQAPGVFLSSTPQYTANSVWLDTTSLKITAAAASMGITAPAAASAAVRVQNGFDALDATLATGAAPSADVLQGAAAIQHAPNVASAAATLTSLSGQLHAASAAMLFDSIDAAGDALAHRFTNLLDGRSRAGIWYGNLGWQGNLSGGGYAGSTWRSDGSIAGADLRVGPHALLGYAVGASQGHGQLDAAWDHTGARFSHVMLYGGWSRGAWYATARLGGGWYRADMQRLLLLGGLAAPVASQSNGRYQAGALESGFQWRAGALTLAPFIDVRYQRLQQGAFAEQGGYGFGLMADARAVGRLQSGLGLRGARDWRLANGMAMQFDGSAAWRHALHQYGAAFDASFTGFDQWLPVSGVGLSRNETVLHAGLSLWPTARTALQLGITREQGERQQSTVATLQGVVRF